MASRIITISRAVLTKRLGLDSCLKVPLPTAGHNLPREMMLKWARLKWEHNRNLKVSIVHRVRKGSRSQSVYLPPQKPLKEEEKKSGGGGGSRSGTSCRVHPDPGIARPPESGSTSSPEIPTVFSGSFFVWHQMGAPRRLSL